MRFAFILVERASFPVSVLCRVISDNYFCRSRTTTFAGSGRPDSA